MPNLPNLGSKAPDFTANSTNGPIRLSDFQGKWVVLFSHPGDFSPVCTTEFLEFTKYHKELQIEIQNFSLLIMTVTIHT